MPFAPPKHCAHGHPPYTGQRCPACSAAFRARTEANRPSARQRGYDRDWQAKRAAFLRAHPTCVACGAPASVVDHVTPHKGDKRLFADPANWQALCATCHGRKTVRNDGGFGLKRAIGAFGANGTAPSDTGGRVQGSPRGPGTARGVSRATSPEMTNPTKNDANEDFHQ
jgi:5-methylcytosine-specific restriction protein A